MNNIKYIGVDIWFENGELSALIGALPLAKFMMAKKYLKEIADQLQLEIKVTSSGTDYRSTEEQVQEIAAELAEMAVKQQFSKQGLEIYKIDQEAGQPINYFTNQAQDVFSELYATYEDELLSLTNGMEL